MLETSDPATAEVEIIYRDDRLLAVTKPSGMIVHRGWGQDRVTVADVVRDEFVKAPVHALHRLDRGTSGVLLFALDAEAAKLMNSELESADTEKSYIALVRGPMRDDCIVDHPVRQRGGEKRVDAVTEFRSLAHSGRWSLVEALPRTGRLHQIRRHLKHLNNPVVGDVLYGKGEVNRLFRAEYNLHRLALHARRLSVKNLDGSLLVLQSPLTPDLAVPLEQLGVWPIDPCTLG